MSCWALASITFARRLTTIGWAIASGRMRSSFTVRRQRIFAGRFSPSTCCEHGSYKRIVPCFDRRNVLLQATHQLVGDLGQPTFAVIHLPLPHFPFCFDASGPRPARAVYAKDSEELLLGHLAYTDRVIGRMLQHLAEVGQFDNSTIVITSDHNWRNDPQLSGADDDALTHVPLWIKLPDQRRPYDSTQRVTTTRLMALLRLLGSQGGDAVTVHATLQQDASFGQPPIVDERDLRFTSR